MLHVGLSLDLTSELYMTNVFAIPGSLDKEYRHSALARVRQNAQIFHQHLYADKWTIGMLCEL